MNWPASTPLTKGQIAAAVIGPVVGTLYIFGNWAKVVCLRRQLSSNVRALWKAHGHH